MVLITEQEYARMKMNTQPVNLPDKNLPADQQQTINSSAMLEERRMKQSSEVDNVSHDEIKPEPLSSDFIINSIQKFANQRRKRALDIFNKLQFNDRIGWNEKGEVSIDSAVIAGSNILDLIYFATNTRHQMDKVTSPIGWELFHTLIPKPAQRKRQETSAPPLSPVYKTPEVSLDEWLTL